MSRKAQPGGTSSSPELTEAEWAVMKVVWEHQPCAAGTVQEALEKSRGWAYSTVKTTMDRMVAKGLLATQRIRNLQLFTARLSEPQARQGELRKMLQRAFNGALAPMLEFVAENEQLTEEDIDQLREIVKKARKSK